jgi:hypothetical protein
VIPSAKHAIRILRSWQRQSSKLRLVLGNNHSLLTCHCTIHSVEDASWIWCVGTEKGDEVRFDLAGALSIALINCDVEAERDSFMAETADEAVSVTWADGTRLKLVHEKRSAPHCLTT